jgi:hypothetical protein
LRFEIKKNIYKMSSSSSNQPEQDPKTKALNGYRRRLLEHRELDAKLKESTFCHI